MDNANLKKLAVVINRYSRQREQNLRAHSGLDNKRPRAWCEYGYKDTIEFEDYFKAYDRDGLGNAAIALRADTVWQDSPKIAQGGDEETFDTETEEEKRIAKHLNKIYFWDAMKMADTMRMVGGYSYIIFRIADNNEFDQPVAANSIDVLVEVIPVWKSQITVNRDAQQNIVSYTYKEPVENGTTKDVKVHPHRIQCFGDMNNGRPMLKAGYNQLTNLEKILGGSGESFLKNAARQMNINFDSDIDLNTLATAYGLNSVDELQKVMNDTAHELNSGIDLLMMTQGAQTTPLTVAVSDPEPSFNVNLQVFAASVKTPVKVLVGQITGERASTQDIKQFNGTCQSWRINEAEKAVRKTINRLVEYGMISFDDFSVVWSDLTAGTVAEKAEAVASVATIITAFAAAEQNSIMLGGEVLVSREELRNLLGLKADG